MMCYVLQHKTQSGEWRTWDMAPFSTLAEAREFCDLYLDGIVCRIAEAHTVTLYRPIKEV